MLLYYIVLIVNHLKLAWNLLINYALFPNIYNMQEYPATGIVVGRQQQLGVIRYKYKQRNPNCSDDDDDSGNGNDNEEEEEEEEEAECAVCLSKIEEDDEMRDLRCNHLFHKVCLDRWLGYSHSTTCPICRTSLSPANKLVAGVEVLMFNYCTFNSSPHRDNWWLR